MCPREPLMPSDIGSKDFLHQEDTRTGDAHNFTVRLNFRDDTKSPSKPSKYSAAYNITDTEWKPAKDQKRLDELVADHQGRAERFLVGQIERQLRSDDMRLMRVDGELVKQKVEAS